jgi:pimeloyl-ACP methyl ester carboxylesterase
VVDGVILVGWSLGGMFLAKYLSETEPKKHVKAAFLLAAPSGVFADESGAGGDCVEFRPEAGKVVNLTRRIPHLEIWHSKDDPVVPIGEVEWYRAHVPRANFVIFEDRNHFLVESLPELIAAIKQI